MGGGVVIRTVAIAPCVLLAAAAGMAVGAPSTAQLAGQRIAWPVDGTTVSAAMRAGIGRGEVGAVILFGRNARSPTAVRRLTSALQAVPRPAGLDVPILVMADQEGGLVKRFPWAPPSASAARMGARLTPARITAQGRATGAALARMGVNTDLAPVCDVAMRGGDIAATGRAFGSTASAAGVGCTAFARGLATTGVAAAAKHFPGFGRARVNTDDARVRIAAPRAVLMADLSPFRQAVAAGVPMVMVSSAIYPALAPLPAMLAPQVVGDLLRDDVGFRGAVVSDAVDAPALAPYGGVRGASARAAAAGVDLVVVSGTEASARQAQAGVAAALSSGAVRRADAEASLARVLAVRRSAARAAEAARATR